MCGENYFFNAECAAKKFLAHAQREQKIFYACSVSYKQFLAHAESFPENLSNI
jgi:hypothetical protein